MLPLLAAEYGVKVWVQPADLTRPGAARVVAARSASPLSFIERQLHYKRTSASRKFQGLFRVDLKVPTFDGHLNQSNTD